MAKQHPTASDVVEEFESLAERFARWVAHHPLLAGGIAVAVLAVAGGIGAFTSWRHSRQDDASNALDSVRVEYLQEMGAPPGAVEVPELANPKAAQEIRERYLIRFREVATAHSGSTAGTTENRVCICPPARSTSAGVMDLYGTCTRSMPAMVFNISAHRCGGDPLPPEPYESAPGFAFASAINSFTEVTGIALLTTKM